MSMMPKALILTLAYAVTGCAANNPSDLGSAPASAQSSGQGMVWSTPDGETLYTFANDLDGQSNCYDGCAQKWPPFTAEANDQPQGDFTITTRSDNSRQWRYKGQPLYTWIQDQQAGDTTGHGVKNIWFVARADDVPVKVFHIQDVAIFTDGQQRSLYTFDKDSLNQSNCYQQCATLWPPLHAAENAKASGPFSIVKRNDGTAQWALNGKPLYTWVKDKQPGDISGDGVKGVWHLATQP